MEWLLITFVIFFLWIWIFKNKHLNFQKKIYTKRFMDEWYFRHMSERCAIWNDLSDICFKIIQKRRRQIKVWKWVNLLGDGYAELWLIILFCCFCICSEFSIMKSKKEKNFNLIIWCQWLGRKSNRQSWCTHFNKCLITRSSGTKYQYSHWENGNKVIQN